MREWLTTLLEVGREVFEDHEEMQGWVLGRGISEELIEGMALAEWPHHSLLDLPNAPDEDFRTRYGGLGQALRGSLVLPLWSPRMSLLGVQVRGFQEKKLTRYLLPDAQWNPVWVGMTASKMERIWNGGAIWACEGDFDMGALDQAVPETDVALGCLTAKMSDRHVEFCSRFVKRVHLVFDNDEPGQQGTFGWIDEETGKRRWGALTKLQRAGVECRAVPYRGGKDPGEVWERTGTVGLRRALNIT